MNTPDTTGPAKSLLLDRVRDKIRLKHCSIRTETAYVDWIHRFMNCHRPFPCLVPDRC
ncbi:MAG: phage integrase N-terminal SAM-like domain-containing protein [Betaproteobacteria bacterium]